MTTAVKIEIAGAIAIIQGTAVAGVNFSLDSSLSTSASGWSSPKGPTRLGPSRAWKRPSSLRSSSRIIGTTPRTNMKITSAFTIWTPVDSTNETDASGVAVTLGAPSPRGPRRS